MCVAAVIFNPIPLSWLECMENDNPHGAGVAWEHNNKIQFVKGLTAKEIYDMQEAGAMSYPYLLHFRWATHGDKVAELTHPFPLGPRALLGETSGCAESVLIHNGTWNYYDTEVRRHLTEGNYEIPEEVIDAGSDTAIAAWLAFWDQSVLDSVAWATAIAEMVEKEDGSRAMDITTRGTWYDKDGSWFSNLMWVPWEGYNKFNDGSMYSSWASGFRDGHTYEYEKPDKEKLSSSEYAYWDDCIKGHGWMSMIGNVPPAARREDKNYAGKYNQICVSCTFYDTWWPEKDHYKPDNVTDEEWYDRFNWEKMSSHGRDSRTYGNSTGKTIQADSSSRAELVALSKRDSLSESNAERPSSLVGQKFSTFDEYLEAKYGPEVAREINNCFREGGETTEECAEATADTSVLPGWEDSGIEDPDWLADGDDPISDNPNVVNAWLAKQMAE